MHGPEMRAARLRGQVLLVLLVSALAGAFGQPLTAASALGQPLTAAAALGALALVAAAFTVVAPIPATACTGVTGARLRAWGREESAIRRAEEPDRPGRPRPRAPGAGCAAPER